MTIAKLDASTPDLTRQNIERLLELFPECRTEGSREDAPSVDFDLLRQALSDYLVEGPAERYRLDWPGKRQALLTANTPIDKTLRPMREESVDFDTTRNLFIEGDNLDALKLLQETYLGKVKMIYIDPPYNTGNDFIYRDDFAVSRTEYEEESGQRDEAGGRLVANPETSGRYHSNWLSMIYPRMKLARNFLTDDGAIFISIANEEMANVQKICDEIFGDSNFVECITWNKRVPKNDKGIGNIHDFIFLYSKDKSVRQEFRMAKDGLEGVNNLRNQLKAKEESLPKAEKEIAKYYRKHSLDRGITLYNRLDQDYRLWGKINMNWPGTKTEGPRYEVLHPIHKVPVKVPDRGWRWKFSTFAEAAGYKDGEYSKVETLHDGSVRCGRIWFSDDPEQQPSSISYLDELDSLLLRSILSFKSGGGKEVSDIVGVDDVFSNPKPLKLIKTLIRSMQFEPGDVVMDFFSGSATTFQAVLEICAEDDQRLRTIQVQLPEEVEDERLAKRFTSIADVSRERVRRAGAKILEENPNLKGALDTGFRAFRVDSGNLVDTSVTPKEATQEALVGMVSHIKDDRSEEDLLVGALLRWGVDITLPVEQRELAGRKVLLVDAPEDGSGKGAALIACFAKPGGDGKGGVDTELADAMAELAPLRVLFRDDGFANDATKENVHSRFQQRAPDTQVRVL